MDVNGVRRLMRREIAKNISQAQWARDIGESVSALNMMLKSRDPSAKVLAALELEKLPTAYRRKKGIVK
jgi:hypothetical protein